LAGLTGSNPEEVFAKFSGHLNDLLHKTVCDAPLTHIHGPHPTQAQICFRQGNSSIAAKLNSGGWYLFLVQTVRAVRESPKSWRLRTLKYSYRIQRGPSQDDPYLFRYEYVSRELEEFLHPRHHCHIHSQLRIPGKKKLHDLDKSHFPTGWVTIEEIIRFLIHSLNVKSRKKRWDAILKDSEEEFRKWTGRSI